ncbi:DUF4097 family beta strand repeat-containing protein [Sediminicola luteus]|nr:DUF4097 family beta strand repeat-containing protein [Sediminicola luteus]
MKKVSTLIAFLSVCLMAHAQKSYTHSLSGIKKVVVSSNTTMEFKTGNSNELVIGHIETKDGHQHHDHNDDQIDERAKGLTPIYAGGNDNTNGFGFSVEKEGDVLKVKDLKSFMQRSGLRFTLPKGIDLSIDTGNLGSADVNGFDSDIEVNSNVGGVVLTNVTGPITARTSTGNIEVVFTEVNQTSPISLRSSTGAVDVSLPANTKANLELKSTMGNVFTDFDVKYQQEEGMKVVGANRKIDTQINGGGVLIKLSSSVGNVYLRKK